MGRVDVKEGHNLAMYYSCKVGSAQAVNIYTCNSV